MPINLFSKSWNTIWKILPWILLIVVLWFRGCSSDTKSPQIAKVTIPEVKGKFEHKKPTHEPIYKDSIIIVAGKTIYTKNPINQKLIAENEKLKADFAVANDSIKQLLFGTAIKLNKFSTKFEDDNLLLNIEGVVQGEVQEVTPSYTIKKKEVAVVVKQKETVFRVLVGGAVGVNKELNQAAYQLDLNFQNRKGNIISAEYLNIGNQQFGLIGFKKSIINIKK
jgi:hypothetical protein